MSKKKKKYIRPFKEKELTFVYTAISNSKKLQKKYEKSYLSACSIHDSVIRSNIKKYSGIEVKRFEDKFFIVFKNPEKAIYFSMNVQRQLLLKKYGKDLLDDTDCCIFHYEKNIIFKGLRIKIGIHIGMKFILKQNKERKIFDYIGVEVHLTEKLCEMAQGGQIIISEKLKNMISHLLLKNQYIIGVGNVDSLTSVSTQVVEDENNKITESGAGIIDIPERLKKSFFEKLFPCLVKNKRIDFKHKMCYYRRINYEELDLTGFEILPDELQPRTKHFDQFEASSRKIVVKDFSKKKKKKKNYMYNVNSISGDIHIRGNNDSYENENEIISRIGSKIVTKGQKGLPKSSTSDNIINYSPKPVKIKGGVMSRTTSCFTEGTDNNRGFNKNLFPDDDDDEDHDEYSPSKSANILARLSKISEDEVKTIKKGVVEEDDDAEDIQFENF